MRSYYLEVTWQGKQVSQKKKKSLEDIIPGEIFCRDSNIISEITVGLTFRNSEIF